MTGDERARPPIQFDLEPHRNGPVPLFFQLATQLEAAIAEQQLRPGDRIENEVDLALRLGISRPTVARAVNELVGKGLLVRRRGIGTEVANPSISRKVGLSSLFDDLQASGRDVTSEILGCEIISDAPRAERLGVATRTPLWFIERLRLVDGEPFAVMRNWIPQPIVSFTSESLREQGLYELLQRAGHRITQAEQQIGARLVTGFEAEQLKVRRGTAVLTLHRVAFDSDGVGIEIGEHAYRADSYTIDMSVSL